MVCKGEKDLAYDMKQIYTIPTKEAAKASLNYSKKEVEIQIFLCY